MKNKLYFDEVASKWDSMQQSFFSDGVREVALKIANVQPGKTAADIGAGTGFITEALLRHGLHVIAVDHSPNMIKQMEDKFRSEDKLDIRLSPTSSLPLENGSADYVFANMYLHHTEFPGKAILEMARILKVGGVLMITDLDEHEHEFLRVEQRDRWLGFRRTNISKWITEAGLEQADVISTEETCCADSDCGCQKAAISIFVASGRKMKP